MSIFLYPLIFLAGALAGAINTLAGNGSLVSLAMLSYIGLPSTLANGTNRLGVLVQSIVGTRGFYKGDKSIPFKDSIWVVLSTCLGAILGSRMAVSIDEKLLDIFLAVLMLAMFIIILWNPGGGLFRKRDQKKSQLYLLPVYFAIGIYGGFIQAGVGIFLLMAMISLGGMDLLKATGLKLLVVLVYTIPALAIFIYYDQINWWYAIWLSAGQALGAYLAVRFALEHKRARYWIRILLLVIVALGAGRFFWMGLVN